MSITIQYTELLARKDIFHLLLLLFHSVHTFLWTKSGLRQWDLCVRRRFCVPRSKLCER